MIQMNGELSAQYGAYHAALFIHIVGSVFAAATLAFQKKPFPSLRNLPLWMFTGGVIGVLTTVFDNLAFSQISLTSILALSLFAQLVFSYLIDTFGWFGMVRHPGKSLSITGLLLALSGIALMFERSSLQKGLYVLLSTAAGLTVVLSRTVNARLADRIGALQGSLVNHLIGLPVCLLLAFSIPETAAPGPFRLRIWCGGILGVGTVALCNFLVPKIPAYRLTLLSFCGQFFCGVLLDLLGGSTLNEREFFAGLLVAAGVAVNQVSEIRRQKQAKRRKAYYERIARIENEHWDFVLWRAKERQSDP
ncbi:MAG: DMT family transporter [Eubacteriales bacterium]|nr:DMT family transporter [Eubacteriales bacterium]